MLHPIPRSSVLRIVHPILSTCSFLVFGAIRRTEDSPRVFSPRCVFISNLRHLTKYKTARMRVYWQAKPHDPYISIREGVHWPLYIELILRWVRSREQAWTLCTITDPPSSSLCLPFLHTCVYLPLCVYMRVCLSVYVHPCVHMCAPFLLRAGVATMVVVNLLEGVATMVVVYLLEGVATMVVYVNELARGLHQF